MTNEEARELFNKCNDKRKILQRAIEAAPKEERRKFENELAFNNGQMNIIRKYLTDEDTL